MLNDTEIVFLPRHGYAHTIPPHRVNYRANLWALKSIGIERVLAVTAVGGIGENMAPGKLAFPDQLIDYTYGREHTFFVDHLDYVTHIDFTNPYDEVLRRQLIAAAEKGGLMFIPSGTYGATQGPRLETAAEINRMEQDGCTMVGMTGMPETALARELELEYACCALVSNWAAGRGSGGIHAAIETHLKKGLVQVARLLEELMAVL
jgi:5'-methylthioinosine phosphorylase